MTTWSTIISTSRPLEEFMSCSGGAEISVKAHIKKALDEKFTAGAMTIWIHTGETINNQARVDNFHIVSIAETIWPNCYYFNLKY